MEGFNVLEFLNNGFSVLEFLNNGFGVLECFSVLKRFSRFSVLDLASNRAINSKHCVPAHGTTYTCVCICDFLRCNGAI